MRAFRITLVTLATPVLAALPYVVLLFVAAITGEREGGPGAFGYLVIASAIFVTIVLGWIFLGLARLRWKERSMVVRQHLHAWPPCLAALLAAVIAVPAVFVNIAVAAFVCVFAVVSGLIGYGATRLWERCAYP